MTRLRLLIGCLLLLALPLAAAAQAQTSELNLDPAEAADLADPDGVFLELGDYTVYAVEAGDPAGPPVILFHGFLGSTVDWDNTIPALAEAGYRVIAFDRPPFGLSSKATDADYGPAAMSDLTAALMDALAIEQALLVGHSAGGAAVAEFALRYPERVMRLALVAGAIGLNLEGDTQGDSPFAGFFQNLDPDSPLAQAALRAFFLGAAQSLVEQSVSDPGDLDSENLARRARAFRVIGWEGGLLAFTRDAQRPENQLDLETLRTLDIPSLLIWGEDDQIVPLAVGERLRDLLPENVWISYPGVGHIPMDETTDAFNADLLAWLKDGDG